MLTDSNQVSILAHLHRVDLREMKVSIKWQISCEPPVGEEPVNPPQEDAVDFFAPEHGGYVVNVYLTGWVQFWSDMEGYPLLT